MQFTLVPFEALRWADGRARGEGARWRAWRTLISGLALGLALGLVGCVGPRLAQETGSVRPDALPRSLGTTNGPQEVTLAEPLAFVVPTDNPNQGLDLTLRRVALEAGLGVAQLEALREEDPPSGLMGCPGCVSDKPRDVVLDTLLPFQITPEIRAFAERNTRNAFTPFQKITALVQAIYVIGHIEQQYEAGRTSTAQETLVRLRGNCFSFTNLLVASARAAGIQAYFMDATRSQSALRFDGERMLHTGHIVAGVPTNMGLLTIDFYKVRAGHEQFWYQRLTDEEAVALYVNNLGYDALRHKQDGIPFFRTATLLAPRLEAPWNNLATVLRSEGRVDEARSVLETAVARRPGSFAPYYNLGLIYMAEGRFQQAQAVFERAMMRRFDNPYVFFNLGVAYLKGGHPTRARLALARAVKLDSSNVLAKTKLDRLKHGL